MNPPSSCLLLTASPRGRKSTSHATGSSLLALLKENGLKADEALLYQEAGSEDPVADAVAKMGGADLTLLAFPLYVDSLPSQVIRMLELAESRGGTSLEGRGLAVLVNSGFPERGQMDMAIRICRLFARDMGMEWMGALALPAGPMINGTPLAEAGGRARHQVSGLVQAAQALKAGHPVPEEAAEEYAALGVPRWLYVIMANRGWGAMSRRGGARVDLRRAPYK